ncbi:SDR family NAD(P)-dependent oxidoreductase [Pseudoxanthomonas putridarboris]|uniref:SDR family oxidoreductase n=1 Tax=Pseudoxanthomonas putridarboris TaxID=752605 RepID=A0ABU9J1K6_9GAMM
MATDTRTVIITGGTRGVGRAVAEHLAGLGYNLAISYSSDAAAAEATRAAIAAKGRDCLILKGDSRSRDSTEELFAAATQRFGTIYGVLANAGVENVEAPFSEMTEDELDRVVDINFKGTFFTLQQAARTVVDGGRIIATASTIASYPPPGSGVYAATKAAVRLMVQVLSLELGPRGITVNSLDPGAVEGAGIFTHMTDELRQAFYKQSPMGKLPRPSDLVGAVEFLLSDGAAMVSGHNLAVTAGFRI